ncbi:hypothetical protein PN4B1_16650 [Paenibacillus naphthalenovorans]|uniref:hypothetical protein n=1 Tax=Paenibacillus naphthalenovorans TaxID=162209 RepID=UPI0010B4D237|nr:hypothetical protein [Paenibacillus naphthalenovorans]GCL71760.1 hypothetical protein PN4B1_16650 [Paenibacillus naphthalenovorans]
MTITHNGIEYQLVRDWEPDEKLAYRNLPNGRIEMLEILFDQVTLTTVHVGFMKLVLEARDVEMELEKVDKQLEWNYQLNQDIENVRESA